MPPACRQEGRLAGQATCGPCIEITGQKEQDASGLRVPERGPLPAPVAPAPPGHWNWDGSDEQRCTAAIGFHPELHDSSFCALGTKPRTLLPSKTLKCGYSLQFKEELQNAISSLARLAASAAPFLRLKLPPGLQTVTGCASPAIRVRHPGCPVTDWSRTDVIAAGWPAKIPGMKRAMKCGAPERSRQNSALPMLYRKKLPKLALIEINELE